MKFKFASSIFLLAVAIVLMAARQTFAQSPAALPDGYSVYKSEALTEAMNGITGSLQILADSRITPDIRKAMWNVGPADFTFYGSALADQFAHQSLQLGHLRIVDAAGRVIADETLERPLADIDTAYLYSDNFPTYLVAVDYSSGCCNSGPATMLLEVRGGKLQHVMTSFLSNTLRSAWTIVEARNGKGKEIEKIDSNAEEPNGDFVTHYRTYRFNGTQWVGEDRSEKGYWEVDGQNWPSRDKFP